MSSTSANLADHIVGDTRPFVRRVLVRWIAVFLLSYVVLFFGMTRRASIFDEGIVLTAAMRVVAGQIPHRDFYALYGPAQFYILAALFKIFGESVLVERIFDLFCKALVITSIYAIASEYCRKLNVAFITVFALMWFVGLNQWPGSPVMPVSLLNLIGAALILPVFAGRLSFKRALAAGAVGGMAALFRYDTGIALLMVDACAIAIASCLRGAGISSRLRTFASAFCPYLLGFALVTVPPLIYYLSIAPLAPLVHDMFLYPAKYYYRGRNLPFPGVHLHTLENLGIYLPVAIAALSFYVVLTGWSRITAGDASGKQRGSAWLGVVVTFGLLTLAMFGKGYVRVSLFQMSLAIIPSLLLVGVLFEHRSSLSRAAGLLTACLLGLSCVPAASFSFHEAKDLYQRRFSVPQFLVSTIRGRRSETQIAWCKHKTPLTLSFCFVTEDDRMRTIAFIDSHTRPEQRIYVGLANHQKIFASDNIIYFAAQRLPATKWSELDPDLESRYAVQKEMVQEFETNAPPYIVLDSEFAWIHEANDSSISSGVTLLDDYIQDKYRHVETFGPMSIWQRNM